MSPSYGHAYLTSYGWAGAGTGLRKGAIEKPLAIPQKKNLGGLGRDRDDAFAFWDHLFSAASKAITIHVSTNSDDEDGDGPEDPDPSSHVGPALLRRTTTGILSNRRPVAGTSASESTSGSATPNSPAATVDAHATAPGRLSLLVTAKREAAKCGLYARFFRGPVLGPDEPSRSAPALVPSSSPSLDASESGPILHSQSMPVPKHNHIRDRGLVGDKAGRVTEKKRKTRDGETREERRERKRLKRERKATRAAKRAEKALTGKMPKEKKDGKAQVQQEETRSEDDELSKRARKHVRKPEPAMSTRKKPEEGSTSTAGPQNNSHRPPSGLDFIDTFNTALTTKKKNGKRKDTLE